VFRRGSSVAPQVQPSPGVFDGVAIPSSVRLLSLRVTDPGGGPPWGLRVARTTRGLTCLQLGRVEFGSVGALGQDGAFADDGLFHPFSVNLFDDMPFGCVITDARGHAFGNVVVGQTPASGWLGGPESDGGCVPAGQTGRGPRGWRRCPAADLRDISYGLLGPDAVSVTERTASGARVTVPTSGPDGAYLVVQAHHPASCRPQEPSCPQNLTGVTGGPNLSSGFVTAVTYRDGHTCQTPPFTGLQSGCPPVGFVAPPTPRLTAAQLSTPIHVSVLRARWLCAERLGPKVKPCDRSVPRGYWRLTGLNANVLVTVSFRTRVAITSSRSSYSVGIVFPRNRTCTAGGEGGSTFTDYRRGQRVSEQFVLGDNCPGLIRGTVTYERHVEPGAGSFPADPFGGAGTVVGRFSFRVR
jgi:hypothetical protein